jgi:hypothetical protein
MKFTFKTEKPDNAFQNYYHNVKLKRKEVGMIDNDAPHRICFAAEKADINEDGNPNCSWKWIALEKRFGSVAEAKTWLNENVDAILAKYKLYKFED